MEGGECSQGIHVAATRVAFLFLTRRGAAFAECLTTSCLVKRHIARAA